MPETDVVELKKADLLAAYKDGNDTNKELLRKLYPKVFVDIRERIKNMSDLYNEAGVNASDYETTPDMSREQKLNICMKRELIIGSVFNQGWKADWADDSQKKWYPLFKYNKATAGFGFSDSYYDCTGTHADVGSRFASKEISDHVGRVCVDHYNEFILLINQ